MDDNTLQPRTPEAQRVDAYLDTVGRMEPDIAMVDHNAAVASIAISLKRIADSLSGLSMLGDVANVMVAKMKEEGLL